MNLTQAQRRYSAVLTQVENDLQEHGIGSSVIDYSVQRSVKGKKLSELDEAAFIAAADQISKNGGQVAACGISILSPRRLYVAARNRPVFVVRRLENDDFMVVSDINAALGLFPQQLIYEKREALESLEETYNKKISGLAGKTAGTEVSRALKKAFKKEKADILKAFSVEIHALEGEDIFARIVPRIFDGMVLLAKKLRSLKVIMTAITEKTFSDMALVVAKSSGVIAALSGEEVTVSSVKSTVCMLFCLTLFCLWLASHTPRKREALGYLKQMHRIPYVIANLLENETVKRFSKKLAREDSQNKASLVVSAVFSNGLGNEIALKLEENSWTTVGRALDYREVLETDLPADLSRVLVVVDATCGPRLDEALEVMAMLYGKKIKFAAVGIEGRQEERTRQLSRNHCIFLPGLKISEMQPFVALIFYYQLAFFYGLFHGIAMGVGPRNRAKSMTVGRRLFTKVASPAAELLKIKRVNERQNATVIPPIPSERRSLWEKEALTKRSRQYYGEMREIAGIISSKEKTGDICLALDENTNQLAYYLFDDNSDVDEIVFAPMDRAAEAAVKSAAPIWSRFLGHPVRIISPETPLCAFDNNTLLFTATSSPNGEKNILPEKQWRNSSTHRRSIPPM